MCILLTSRKTSNLHRVIKIWNLGCSGSLMPSCGQVSHLHVLCLLFLLPRILSLVLAPSSRFTSSVPFCLKLSRSVPGLVSHCPLPYAHWTHPFLYNSPWLTCWASYLLICSCLFSSRQWLLIYSSLSPEPGL